MPTFTVNQTVRVKSGNLPGSDFRPHQGKVGVVTRVFEGERYSVAVRFPDKGWGTITYHKGELEAVSA